MEKEEVNENKKIEELANAWEKLCRDQAVISAAIQYKKSQEIINEKTENESASLAYGISMINRKVLDNIEKYQDIENEMNTLLENYKKYLTECGEYHDSQIVMGYAKILTEEIKQCRLYKHIYYLQKDEQIAIEKVDNSDDIIREKICNIEDEISNSDLKIRRLKPSIRKKISDKENEMFKIMETEEQAIQKETIKGPRIFNKATRFFFGKINPYKMIKKNVFNNLKNRIEVYEISEERNIIKKSNEKYKEESIIKTIDEIIKKEDIGEENA